MGRSFSNVGAGLAPAREGARPSPTGLEIGGVLQNVGAGVAAARSGPRGGTCNPVPRWRLALFRCGLVAALLLPTIARAQPAATSAAQIAGALSAAPEDRREGARVLGYSADGGLLVLREGTNDLVCVADEPGDERFHAVCYHRSLEPYIARGRALRAEGVAGPESLEIRHREAEEGKLPMPEAPATLYNRGGPLSIFDPATGEVTGGSWLWSIYIPYATEESTGLPTSPQTPGAPWIMRPGTASSHIMIVPPREPEPDPQP